MKQQKIIGRRQVIFISLILWSLIAVPVLPFTARQPTVDNAGTQGTPVFYMSIQSQGGKVYKSINGGISWFLVENDLPDNTIIYCLAGGKLSGLCSKELYAGTRNGIYRTVNGGINWSFDGLSGDQIYDIDIVPTTHAVYAAADHGVYYRNPSTQTWSCIGFYENPDPPIVHQEIYKVSVCYADPAVIYVAGNGGEGACGTWVYKTSDGGQTWIDTNGGFSIYGPRALAVNQHNPDDVCVGSLGNPYIDIPMYGRSRDGGASWERGWFNWVYDIVIDPMNPHIVYVGGVELCTGITGIFKSDDFGDTYTLMLGDGVICRAQIQTNPSNPAVLYSVIGRVEGQGEKPYFVTTSDNGFSWNYYNVGLPQYICAASGLVVDIEHSIQNIQ
jgi:hypothetical protein